MRKLLFILITSVISFSLFAEDIPTTEKDRNNAGNGGALNDKELVVGVSASIEDGVLTIATDVATHGVVATIYGSGNAVVYTSVSTIEGKTHEFIVGELLSGDYILEVAIGDTLASGEFTIE